MSQKSIGVIGAGAVGLAIAAEYSLTGYEVYLTEIDGFFQNLPPNGEYLLRGLLFKYHSEVKQPVKISVKETLDYDDFNKHSCSGVILATTAMSHDVILPRLNQILDPSIPLIVICGNGSTLSDIPNRQLVAETNTAPYGVRKCKNGINIKIITPRFGVTTKSKDDLKVLKVLQLVYPECYQLSHVVDATLSNPNPLMHVSIMLANLTRIDKAECFTFYDQGVTDSVMRLILAKDSERMAIARSVGYEPVLFDELEGVIEREGHLVTQHFLECGNYSKITAPTSIQDRYFTEDVPYGLVVWEAIAKKNNVPTPIISAEINQVSAILERDLRSELSLRTDKILEWC